jgi:hypothetical protein
MAFIGNGAQLTDLDAGDIASGTLPVARGGTGTTSPSIVAGSGISVSGTWPNQTVAASGGGQLRTQTFTSSTTWTCPTGVTSVFAVVFGGGGGGVGAYFQSAGGGYGGVASGMYTVTPGTNYTITVGGGGTSVSTSGASTYQAGAGGTSSFASFCSASGGGGGRTQNCDFNQTGANGTGSGGTLLNSRVSDETSVYTYMQFSGGGDRYAQSGENSPVEWSPTLTTNNRSMRPGVRGGAIAGNMRSSSSGNGCGGVSGVVFLQYVG